MTKKIHTCIDCRAHAVSHTVERQSRHIVTEKITFSCGALQEEMFDSESMVGRVEFSGCEA